MATTTLSVREMSCEGCEEIVEGALSDVSGVESAAADRETGTATVEGDADPEALVEAVDFVGYEATVSNPDASDDAPGEVAANGETSAGDETVSAESDADRPDSDDDTVTDDAGDADE